MINVAIIGAMKCATTSLFHSIACHPEVIGCETKEPGFFAYREEHAKGLDYYLNMFKGEGDVLLDASTMYSKFPMFPEVPERMLRSGLKFKFIYVVRDPFARMESEYIHTLASGDSAPLFYGIGAFPLCNSNYYYQLARYASCFPREDVLVLKFEELVSDPTEHLARIGAHLNLDPALFGSFDWHHKSDYRLEIIREKWQPETLHIHERIRETILSKPESLYKFPYSLKKMAANYLREDMQKLSREYNINVSDWYPGW